MKYVSFTGIPVVILIGSIVTLNYSLWPLPSLVEAEKRIGLILKMEISQRHMAELKSRGKRLPDQARAFQWKQELDGVRRLEFISVEVNRLIPDVLLLSDSPHFVAKVMVRHGESSSESRYFLLSTDGTDRETSSMAWFFSM